MTKWMCTRCGVVDSTCECGAVADLMDVTHVYRDGQEALKGEAVAARPAYSPGVAERSVGHNNGIDEYEKKIRALPLEGDE